MTYITVTSANGRSFYLAKERIGGGHSVIATFTNEAIAKNTCELLNNAKAMENGNAYVDAIAIIGQRSASR